MPDLTAEHLPELLELNKKIYHEVQGLLQNYLKDVHLRGWKIVDGTRRWMEQNHFLLQAPIKDSSLGGFIFFRKERHICYLNTWQPRAYQNFILLHELYHILTDTGLVTTEPLHLVRPDLDAKIEERKADYFASLLLINEYDLRNFLSSLKHEPLEHRIFYTMERFSAPYKVVLIRMFELDCISPEELQRMFDHKYDFVLEFSKMGLDPADVQRSNVVRFDKIEQLMNQNRLSETAQVLNMETLQIVKQYFDQRKGGRSD